MAATLTEQSLIAHLPTVEQVQRAVVGLSQAERAWLTLGATLVEMHTEQAAATARLSASAAERDTAHFAARGLELAVEAWNETTTSVGRGRSAWSTFARLVAADLSGGYAEAVRAGLVLALTTAQRLRLDA